METISDLCVVKRLSDLCAARLKKIATIHSRRLRGFAMGRHDNESVYRATKCLFSTKSGATPYVFENSAGIILSIYASRILFFYLRLRE